MGEIESIVSCSFFHLQDVEHFFFLNNSDMTPVCQKIRSSFPMATDLSSFRVSGLWSWPYLLKHRSTCDLKPVTIKKLHCHVYSFGPALGHQKPFAGCPPCFSSLLRPQEVP